MPKRILVFNTPSTMHYGSQLLPQRIVNGSVAVTTHCEWYFKKRPQCVVAIHFAQYPFLAIEPNIPMHL